MKFEYMHESLTEILCKRFKAHNRIVVADLYPYYDEMETEEVEWILDIVDECLWMEGIKTIRYEAPRDSWGKSCVSLIRLA